MMRLAAAILLLSALAPAQPRGSGIVAGTVVEASTSKPVRKAVVTLTLQGTPPAWATARTDASGRFRFENLPPGKYGLRANKNGLGSAQYGANTSRDAADIISLGPGDIREGLTLRFLRLGSVSGHVLNADGDPLPGVSVQLQRPTRNLGERVLQNYRGGVSDDRGEYRIANVDTGQYYLLVNPQNGRGRPGALYAAQYYGGVPQSKDSKPLNVRAAENLTGLDFVISPEPSYHIHGRILGVPDFTPPAPPPDNPPPMIARQRGNQVEVSISPVGESAPRSTHGASASGPDYQFDFGDLIGGMYRIDARVHDGEKVLAASQLIDSRAAPADLALPLEPALDISGTLRVEGQLDPTRNLQIGLARFGRNENIFARPDAAGRFTLKQVPPGEWTLNVNNLPPGAFLKSGAFGDRDVRFTRFSVESGTKATLNIAVSTRSSKLDGQIDPGALDPKRAGIVLAPAGAFHDLARFYYGGVADDEGNFHLENLAPGKYRIFALEKTAPAAFRNPDAVDRLTEVGDDIELTEGATAQAHPKLIPAARVREALPAEIRE